ncbi:glycosyltransferase family 4 protein [Candidatus Woesearchaeota archaeon]|nr:glycosyltransferase family 4 protein [Candidatus Woesearchaeota archaeon]
MKVLLHLSWGLPPNFVGGTERFVLNLAKGIKRRGCEAFVVCSNLEDKITIEGIDVYGVVPKEYTNKIKKYGYANEFFFRNEIIGSRLNHLSIAKFSDYVSKQIINFDFDIVHLNAFSYSSLLPLTFPFQKAVVTNHENPQELDNYWGNSFFNLLRDVVVAPSSTLRNIKERVVPSKHYANLFSESFGISVAAIPLGIDTLVFPGYQRNEILRRQYASPDEIVILQPSRFEIKQKGHDITLGALSILKRKGVKVKIIFSGYDNDTYHRSLSELRSLVSKSDLEGNVILTRFNSMLDAYSISDIVVSPERFCSYGLAMSESLALGLPTIISPIPTYREIAKGYNHAHFTKDHSPEELARTIYNIIDLGIRINPPEALRFRQEHSFDNCVDKYLKLYTRLLC